MTISIKIQRCYGSGRHYYVSLRKNRHHWRSSGKLDDVLQVRSWLRSQLRRKRFKRLFCGGSANPRSGFMSVLDGVFITLGISDRWYYDDNN